MRAKTISYRKAEFLIPSEKTLETHLMEAHGLFPLVSQRRIEVPGQPILECLKHTYHKDFGVYLHIAAYTPGEHASVIPKVTNGPQENVATTPPPDDSEFMDGDIMMMVAGNDVLLCGSSLHEKKAERYMIGIIESAGLDQNTPKFALCKRADVDKMRLIQAQGVKSIDLDVSVFDATIEYIERKSVCKKFGGAVADTIKALVLKDWDEEDLAAAENLSVGVSLSFDGKKKNKAFGKTKIEELARMLVEDEDEDTDSFSIQTVGGERIKGSDISLKKKVFLPKHGKSVQCVDAWRAIDEYYFELKNGGLLEQ